MNALLRILMGKRAISLDCWLPAAKCSILYARTFIEGVWTFRQIKESALALHTNTSDVALSTKYKVCSARPTVDDRHIYIERKQNIWFWCGDIALEISAPYPIVKFSYTCWLSLFGSDFGSCFFSCSFAWSTLSLMLLFFFSIATGYIVAAMAGHFAVFHFFSH